MIFSIPGGMARVKKPDWDPDEWFEFLAFTVLTLFILVIIAAVAAQVPC